MNRFEKTTLQAIDALGSNAYGVTVYNKLKESLKKEVSFGAIYVAFERLEEKGFITSQLGEPLPERGGRCKRYFFLTKEGKQALEETEG